MALPCEIGHLVVLVTFVGQIRPDPLEDTILCVRIRKYRLAFCKRGSLFQRKGIDAEMVGMIPAHHLPYVRHLVMPVTKARDQVVVQRASALLTQFLRKLHPPHGPGQVRVASQEPQCLRVQTLDTHGDACEIRLEQREEITSQALRIHLRAELGRPSVHTYRLSYSAQPFCSQTTRIAATDEGRDIRPPLHAGIDRIHFRHNPLHIGIHQLVSASRDRVERTICALGYAERDVDVEG